MSWSRFIFKSHKWLAVVAALPALIWFFSGALILVPGRWFGALSVVETRQAAGPRYEEIVVSVPQAIAAVETGLGREVEASGVSFTRIGGRLLYQVRVKGEAAAQLVDAVSGERLVIDEAKARELLRAAAPGAEAQRATLVERHNPAYHFGPVPVYRLETGDARGTEYFVAVETGEVRMRTRLGRWYHVMDGMHTFNFLQPVMSREGIRMVMLVFGVIGTLMGMFGAAILWVQWVNWRARRRGA